MKLILLGDSHTRGYVDSTFVEKSFFLGPGKTVNFTTALKVLGYIMRYAYVATKDELKSFHISIVIGEPDVRFATYKRYHVLRDPDKLVDPQKVTPLRVDSDTKKLLDRSIARIKLFLSLSESIGLAPYLVIGANSPNCEMALICQEFNQALKSIVKSKNIRFLDPTAIYSASIKENKASWISATVNNPKITDATHFSKQVGLCLDQFLLSIPSNSAEQSTSHGQTLARKLLQLLLCNIFLYEYE